MDRKKVAAKQSMILQTYRIPADRSGNVNTVSFEERKQSENIAAADSHDSKIKPHEEKTEYLGK